VTVAIDEALFQDDAERALYGAYKEVNAVVAIYAGKGDYLAALSGIATLKGTVDAFFDKVMVMAEDERLRTNRLALLTAITRLFGNIADFTRFSV
jgi:glycyl-tRNA synthetase beta chain